MSIQPQIEMLRNEIVNIATRHGAVKISLFGSTVRGQDTSSSDIDFLVDLEEDRTLFDLIRLKHELEDLLNRSVDVISSRSLYWKIKDQIIDEAVQL